MGTGILLIQTLWLHIGILMAKKHLIERLREKVYDPMKPIISGWDFNVAPYMSEMELQINYEKKEIYLLEENLGKTREQRKQYPQIISKNKRQTPPESAYRRNNYNRRPSRIST